ncbi:YidC/Oxa1 family membrane protein insertase [Staphylococcus xylosus]
MKFNKVLFVLLLLVQMSILFGLYFSLKWSSSGGLTKHTDFLWFNLTHPDIWITIIAGILYTIQPLINLENMPKEQRSMKCMMAIISPVVIIYISITSASDLGLYWTINAAFLIIQMFIIATHFDFETIKRLPFKRESLLICKSF